MPHSAVVSTIASIKALLEDVNEAMGPGDSYLSYLPLAHIFDRCGWPCAKRAKRPKLSLERIASCSIAIKPVHWHAFRSAATGPGHGPYGTACPPRPKALGPWNPPCGGGAEAWCRPAVRGTGIRSSRRL